MQSYGDAVILMQHNSSKISYLVGDSMVLDRMAHQRALSLFSMQVVDFIDSISKGLFRNTEAKAYPDVISFAFWCRKGSILGMRQTYPDLSSRCGRGVAFHIAPSNVAVNFAYSLVAGLLSGNANVIRVPSRNFPQIKIICDEINLALAAHPLLSAYVVLIRYERDKHINDWLSGICHSRLIWGGDTTISTVRESPLRARSIDIAFANRHSIALIDAAYYLSIENKPSIAEHFYNDTFLTDQNACTSPKLVVWLGDVKTVDIARTVFWEMFETFSQKRYQLYESVAISKLEQLCLLGANREGVQKVSGKSNLIYRVEVDSLDENIMLFTGEGGFFLEYNANSINEILPVCNERCQTLSTLGIKSEQVSDFFSHVQPAGIDRVVPIGRTLDFSLQWDGYDLIYSLSRTVFFAL